MISNEFLDPTRPEARCTLDFPQLNEPIKSHFFFLKNAAYGATIYTYIYVTVTFCINIFIKARVIAYRKPL